MLEWTLLKQLFKIIFRRKLILINRIKSEWFFNGKRDILSGIVVALALIPEAICFSIIAGVDPMVGLYASFCIILVTAFIGGRPAMISAATGAMALLMVNLVKNHGVEFLFAATILTGFIQVIFGFFKIDKLMKFIPRPVMMGFVNALAILIFTAQLPHLIGISTETYIFAGVTLMIVYIMPRYFRSIPAPLIAIVLLTAVSMSLNLNLKTVGDLGSITRSLPVFAIPNVNFSVETIRIIFPYSLALSFIGILETLLTASIVDEETKTASNKTKETFAQGIANVVAGFFGGMAGCAMIGQSVINVKNGGRGRLSSLTAGLTLIFLILILGNVVVQIPMAILVGIMIMVSVGTFNWESFAYLKKAPKGDAAVMLVTVALVVATHDLSKGVLAGVILSAMIFASKISDIKVTEIEDGDNVFFEVEGQLFFASVDKFLDAFDYHEEKKDILIDFSKSHVWDDSAVGAIDKVVSKYRDNNRVVIKNLNCSSSKLVHSLTAHEHLKPELVQD